MAVHFHQLAVKEIKKETADCVSVSFDVPAGLSKNFEFIPGQNITLKTVIDGEEIRRSYSICTAPHENDLRVAVKKVEGGKFSVYANELLQKGIMLDVLSPTGNFYTAIKEGQQKNYVAFAAGSGITPVISIIKTVLTTEPASSFTLVYSNQTRNSIIFFDELEGLKNKYLQRFQLIHILTREGTDNEISFGRINTEKLEMLSKLINYKQADEFFICGPQEMIFSIKDYLESTGIDKKKIHFELFATAAIKQKVINTAISPSAPAKSIVQVKLDGRIREFSMHSESSILEEALKQGADLPFACKGGMCCTCKAKLLEGKVEMDVHWGLEDEEIEKGYILTCQSHPLTEKVVIDFDAR
ncbi:MAG: phenylacetate-CoA oxygenase/reductase subunit PaaK [Ferruginibacter sp.]